MGLRTYKGNSRTENGWPIVDSNELITLVVAGMGLPVRKGPVAMILKAWVTWYHENVEPIDRYKPLDDWGWSFDNAVANSNHLGGVAVDLNATQYPWGRRVMPADRIAKIRRGQELFEWNIFWGADWDYADEMHYQLAEGTCAGNDASAVLVDFVARRCPNGRLIDADSGPGEAWWTGFMGPVISDTKDNRAQLCGGRDKGEYPGWPQLGKRTPVDGVAAALGVF